MGNLYDPLQGAEPKESKVIRVAGEINANISNSPEKIREAKGVEKIGSIHVMVTMASQTAFFHLVKDLKQYPQPAGPSVNKNVVVQLESADPQTEEEFLEIVGDKEVFFNELKDLGRMHENAILPWEHAKLQFMAWVHRISK